MPGIEKTMHEYKHGTLKSGSGKTVKKRSQAIAIGLNEERKAGHKARGERVAKEQERRNRSK
jgi:hypothetical protein